MSELSKAFGKVLAAMAGADVDLTGVPTMFAAETVLTLTDPDATPGAREYASVYLKAAAVADLCRLGDREAAEALWRAETSVSLGDDEIAYAWRLATPLVADDETNPQGEAT